jgi:hypothetical protein
MDRHATSRRLVVWVTAASLAGLAGLAAHVASAGRPLGGEHAAAISRSACGTERWSIKTMSDPQASNVNLTAHATTISALRAKSAPSSLGTTRIAPVELTTYRIHARLVEFKSESDSDIHLVVADPSTGGQMIVEFPSSSCLSSTTASVKQKISTARNAFVAACGQPSSTHFSHVHGVATITGVGFWDFKHGQTGVAPNAIELHPVLKFSGSCG